MIPPEIPNHLRCSQEWNGAVMKLARTLGSYAIAATQTDEWDGWFGSICIKYRTSSVEWGYDPRYRILVVKEEGQEVMPSTLMGFPIKQIDRALPTKNPPFAITLGDWRYWKEGKEVFVFPDCREEENE